MTLLLNGLSEDQQRELLAAGSPRSLKPRDVLGAQGEAADSIALVQVGHLKLGQLNAEGVETLIRFIGPGDCYGAIALSPGKRFPVSTVAVEPSRVLVWPRAVIAGLAERIPQIRLNLFEEVTRRMSGVLSASPRRSGTSMPRPAKTTRLVFNGHVKALSDHPLMAKVGERVRLYFHNVGPDDRIG